MIDGIGAYNLLVDSNSLKVSSTQPGGSSDTSASINNPRVVEDVVTLSSDAQRFLEVRSNTTDLTQRTEQQAAIASHGNLIGGGLANQNLRGTDLTGIYLYKADLSNAVFDHAVLKDAWLAGTNLSGTSFEGADLRGANLGGATGLTAEQLKSAKIDVKTVLPIGVALDYT